MLDSTNPDLSEFAARGGKMIVTIGTNDTLASPAAQLDYFQSVIDRMGRATVDHFARFFVIPQVGHGLTGSVYQTAGDGRSVEAAPIASSYERFAFLTAWVERGAMPATSVAVHTQDGTRTMPLCSYPSYPAPGRGGLQTCRQP
jgi:feruloyl esterase